MAFDKAIELLHAIGAAAARVIDDDDKPTMVHMRELDRCRANVSAALSEEALAAINTRIEHPCPRCGSACEIPRAGKTRRAGTMGLHALYL